MHFNKINKRLNGHSWYYIYIYNIFVAMLHTTVVQYKKGDKHKMQEKKTD